MQTLSYPIAIRCAHNKQITATLFFFRKVVNFYLRRLCKQSILSLLDEKKYAYKCLEKIAKNPRYYIPSRINRGLLEIAGCILRGVKDRRELYSLLLEIEKEPENWDYELLKKDEIYGKRARFYRPFKKSQYIENLKEQALNYLEEKARVAGGDQPAYLSRHLPDDYLDLVSPPELKNGMITYSPDDGQAIKTERQEDKIKISLKVLKEDKSFSLSRTDWEWIELTCALPDIVLEDQSAGGTLWLSEVTNLPVPNFPKWTSNYEKPDLRLSNISGRLTPILDLKVEREDLSAGVAVSNFPEKKESRNFLTVDWGLNKLVTVCVFKDKGEQISRPFFLKSAAIQNKLLRIRKEIDKLKSKRDSLPKNSTKANWYNQKIAKRWEKFRGIQKQLSHLASNVIVEIAKVYNCCKIYVEWLGSLKSKRLSRTLNWKINSQVRQQIYEKVEYKASMEGIELSKPINPAFTSQFCPKCGKKGVHVKSSDRLNKKVRGGGWFYCKNCGYNADRDYVACQNIARKALYGNKLKGMSKTFVYTAKVISDKLFRQSISQCERLCHNLNGWKNTVFLRPVYLVTGTLRL